MSMFLFLKRKKLYFALCLCQNKTALLYYLEYWRVLKYTHARARAHTCIHTYTEKKVWKS